MGLVSANRLNRFWQKGVKPIKNAIGVLEALSTVEKSTLVAAINELATGKFDAAKIVASTNITEPGFAMDGKTASEALAELYSKTIAFSVTSPEFVNGSTTIDCSKYIPDGYKATVCIAQLQSANTIIISSSYIFGKILYINARLLANGSKYEGTTAGVIYCILGCEEE